MLDLILKNGLVCDPANSIQSILNVGIRNGRIACLTSEPLPAAAEIDCTGHIVSPGFVDAHSHEDDLCEGHIEADITLRALRQGVTTLVTGNCGDAPRDLPAYCAAYDGKQPVNMALLAGHTTIRRLCGARNKYAPVDEATLAAMCETLERQLTEGAKGLSMGIRYEPGMTLGEMCAMAAVVKRFGGVLAAHVRGDAFEIYDAIEEFLEIGRRTGVRLQISHIGSMAAYGQMAEVLSYVDRRAAAEGLDVRIDCYPYDAFCTSIGATTYDDGFLDRYHDVTRIELTDGEYKGFIPNMEVFEKVRREHPEYLTIAHVMNGAEVDMALTHPRTMLGSDGVLLNGAGHPRAAGAFARFLAQYVFERKLLSLNEGIAKTTCEAAARFGLDRGTLGVGRAADVTVFDPKRLQDKATFAEPALPPEGVRLVLLGGVVALQDGKVLHTDLGKIL
ncbi:MAG: amidohydrolase family protein [Christensenellaceae bacterium]|nr:amidohydrolase family protein [Christensenellaceae bacterium]